MPFAVPPPPTVPLLPWPSQVSPNSIKSSIGELRKHVTLIQRTLVAYTPCADLDAYAEVMGPFIEQAAEAVKEIERNYKIMTKSLEAVAAAYGEDLALFQPEEFLLDVNTFVTVWTQALNRRKSALKAAKALKKGAGKSPSPAALGIP